MSVQFGKWSFEGQPAAPDYIEKVGAALAPYGPDSYGTYLKAGVTLLYRAFHTTHESHLETQPHISRSGVVITWDGCLGNRAELICEVRDSLTVTSTDVAIVAAAYEKWGTKCFAKLIGDWALSIWNPNDCSLILGKDPIGTRHLYYTFDKNQVVWSTILDLVVLFSERTFAINEEYIAGWLSMFPAPHLSPWVGIHSVPPSSFLLLGPGKHTGCKYWGFDPAKQIRYRSDAEYEENFRYVFGKAVQRSLRSDRPVLSELSGGRDSSSIVCMADTVIARGVAETPRLDTISYYDDSEPNWNERPYFTKVEEKRGRAGWHIDVGAKDWGETTEREATSEDPYACSMASPHSNGRFSSQFGACLASQGNRVVLSGIGGDEVMGGVPTPIPELEDLLARAQFRMLAHQLKVWALEKRKPWFHLFFTAAQGFLPRIFSVVAKHQRPAPWLTPEFAKHYRTALEGYPFRVKLLGPLPSFQENLGALNTIRRQLACTPLPLHPRYEKRYPYLDRELLEFTFSIPREQLVRPKQRRSLMRRALIGIVPDEILNRKRKAFVARSPLIAISEDWANLVVMSHSMISSSLGIVDPGGFSDVLQKARHGEEIPLVPLLRTIRIESWLRTLRNSQFVKLDTNRKPFLAWQASVQR